MRVVFVNYSDSLGGAATVTRRLVEALRASGTDARMLVVKACRPEPWIIEAAPRWRSRIHFYKEHLRIFAGNGRSRDSLFKLSLASDGLPLSRHPEILAADAVVLGWVNQGMVTLEEIGRIAAMRPTVWTMHDMWPFTGICHHAGKCGAYTVGCWFRPLLHSAASDIDLSYRTFIRKEALPQSIHYVAVSRWLAKMAAESAVTRERPISVIPNATDPVKIPPLTRAELGLPADGRLVTICAARLDDPVKGLPLAIAALNAQAPGTVAVLVGAVRNPHALDDLRIPYVALGPVDDPARRQAIFAHSSAVLSSSHYETFGATLAEAQSAGTTPVGYVHDGRADIITDGVTGYAAVTPGDPASLADALRRALEHPLPPEAMRAAAARFAPASVAAAYRRLLDALQIQP